jgi:hypothetical protein
VAHRSIRAVRRRDTVAKQQVNVRSTKCCRSGEAGRMPALVRNRRHRARKGPV